MNERRDVNAGSRSTKLFVLVVLPMLGLVGSSRMKNNSSSLSGLPSSAKPTGMGNKLYNCTFKFLFGYAHLFQLLVGVDRWNAVLKLSDLVNNPIHLFNAWAWTWIIPPSKHVV